MNPIGSATVCGQENESAAIAMKHDARVPNAQFRLSRFCKPKAGTWQASMSLRMRSSDGYGNGEKSKTPLAGRFA
ncbi:MAG: hypothetical protein Q8S20_20850 [Sulfuritalea sp.]|nr:hypothetical protein [Sulfuritalea sp.]